MELRKLDSNSIEFVFECLKELRGNVEYLYPDFEAYFYKHILESNESSSIFIAYDNETPVGMFTCNRFLMPRYLGFGYELEEFVVHKEYQNMGYGTKILALFFELIKKEDSYLSIRKVIVKAGEQEIAGKLYEKFFTETESYLYLKEINYL